MTAEVAVENSELWQEQLDGIKTELLHTIKDFRKVKIEPKSSMLSIRIAKRYEDGGTNLHTDLDGTPITEGWVTQHVFDYLTNKDRELRLKLKEIVEKVREMPDAQHVIETLQKYNPEGPDGQTGTADDISPEVIEALSDAFQDAAEYRTHEMNELKEAQKIIKTMINKLAVVFNPTAGYVDIFHRDLNKYSTVKRQLEKEGISPSETVMVHIGDSTTDIMPTSQTDPGEINEGAQEVFLVAVQNSSASFKAAIRERIGFQQGKRGFLVAGREVLGVKSVVLGITKVVEEPAD